MEAADGVLDAPRRPNDTYTLRLASDVYPNQPNVRRYPVELTHALFDDRFAVSTVGPFVLAIRKPMSSMARQRRAPQATNYHQPPWRRRGQNHRTARLVAIVAGLLGAALAIATPLLPVTQTTAQLNWPQNGVLGSVDAPLIGYVATDLNITVPCRPPPAGRPAKHR